MKVLLISANRVIEPYPVYPLGVDYVAAAIGSDHDVARLDLNTLADDDRLAEAIIREAPDIIGISLRNIDNTDALAPESYIEGYRNLVNLVRLNSNAPIVLGGSGFTIFPERLMELLGADYGVIGEGERMPMLLRSLQNGDDPTTMPGMIGPARSPLTTVPLPEKTVDRLRAAPDGIEFYLRRGGMLNLQTKRGCPYRCIYCSYPHIEGRAMRLRPPSAVAEDALRLQEAGGGYIFITDSVFNADWQHSLAVAHAFKQAGVTIPWGAFFAPMPPPDGYFQQLAECGLKHVEFGTESLCDDVLKAYGKPFRVADVLAAHRVANAAGVHVAHYFLLAGPGESEQTLIDSLAQMDHLEKTVLFLFCGMRIYPNTALYRLAVRQEQIEEEQDLLTPVFYNSPFISIAAAAEIVAQHARGKTNWVHASGGRDTVAILERMYRKGYVGPLWEYLIR